ncbi:helix-turn-helix transcriptional regulator [Pyxidicoccus parkwayensis]|uniref:Helix-turn-helix transcriptional regulator n=1 Tax=Pyxidicoccus parkwayensis TaxID=2813578 RepID=A0ABX7NT36_9BACT|nr:helix-turn-helix domain-containing protein [Pyxidicoccus parkwaysis]QSQ21534.1 helix-turn-helix transcriptional regulator [Pyxidicoccus parkwaysis]
MASSLERTFNCPVELALEVLGGKWKVVMLARLKEGPLRYAELRRLVPRMSEKMLTQRLRELEEQGLILRVTRPGAAKQAVYTLTQRGESARPTLQALYDWGVRIADEVGARIESPTPAKRRKTA